MKEQSTVILQLKSEKQRLENELKKHESMIKKLLNNTTNTNITNNTSNDIRIEIEKSILIKKLKQYATQLKTLIINKEIEIKELKKNSKITSLLEITIERDEYYYEVQRLKDQLFILQQEKLDWQQQKINILQSNHQQHNIHRNNTNTMQPILPSNSNGSRKTPQSSVSVQPVSVQPPARPQSSQSSRGANSQHRGRVRAMPTETEETYIGGIDILADQSGQQKGDTVDGDYLDGDFEADVVVLKPPPRPASPRLLPNLSSPSNNNNTKSKQKPQTSPYAVSLSPTNAKPSATGSINRTGLPFFDEAKQSAQKDAMKWKNAESVLRSPIATPSLPPSTNSTNSGPPTTTVATPPSNNETLRTSEPPRRPASKPTPSKPNAPIEVRSKEAKARPPSVTNDTSTAPTVETDLPTVVAAVTPAADSPSSDRAATADADEIAPKSTSTVEKKKAPASVTASTPTPTVTKPAAAASKDNKRVTPKQTPLNDLKKSTTTDKLASTHKSDLKKEPIPSVNKDTTSTLKSTPAQLASEVPTAPPSRESEKGAAIEEVVSIISTLDEAVEGKKRDATVVESSLPKETKKNTVPTVTVEKVVVVTPLAEGTLNDKAAPPAPLTEPKVDSLKAEQVESTPSERVKSKRSPRRAAHEQQEEEKLVSARQPSDNSETKPSSDHNSNKADVKHTPSYSPRSAKDSAPTVANKADGTTHADKIHEASVKVAVPIVEAVAVEESPSLLKGESIDDGSSLGALDGGAAVYEEPTIGTLPTFEPSPRSLIPGPVDAPVEAEVIVKTAKTPVAHQKSDSYLDDFLNDLSDDEGNVKGIGYTGPGTESILENSPTTSTVAAAAAADQRSMSPVISAKKDEQSSEKAIPVVSDKDAVTHAVVSHEPTKTDEATITPKAAAAEDEYEEDFD